MSRRFFYFYFFLNLVFQAVTGVKRQKIVQNEKRKLYPSRSTSQEQYVAYDHDFWCICVKWWYLQLFFRFFNILIFQVVSGVKGQKMAQNDKKFCLSRFISQEPYILWLSFMVHLCKMMISPGIFFISLKFLFFGLLVE